MATADPANPDTPTPDTVTPDTVTPGIPTPHTGAILGWYAAHQRDLPWRRPDATPWAVLVSEIMLQQTPVARVIPAHAQWMALSLIHI